MFNASLNACSLDNYMQGVNCVTHYTVKHKTAYLYTVRVRTLEWHVWELADVW